MSRPRAVVVVTGSELVRGERTDLNGPFLAREALRLGLEPARIAIVGDSADELEAALRDGLAADACFVSGGLGPTHDDRTVEMVARALGVGLHVDAELEQQIEAVSRAAAVRLKRDYADFAAGVTKQATIPDGARSLGLAGTAPGLLLAHRDGRVVVILPGPPSELQRLWPGALDTDAFRALLARTRPPGRRVLRLFGVSESAVARALAEAGGDGDGVEVTICARDFEIHVDFVVEPGAEARADALEAAFVPPLERWLFSREERTIEELVLGLCRDRGWTLATAESCTGGLVAARLTGVPGSSDVVLLLRSSPSTARSRRRSPRRWRTAPARDSAPTWPSPSRGSPALAAAPPRSPSGSSTSTRRDRTAAPDASSASPVTAPRSAPARRSERSTSSGGS